VSADFSVTTTEPPHNGAGPIFGQYGLRTALPELRILVGRWGPSALGDESTQVLRDAGADLVASTLLETRTYLAGLVEIPRIPVPETDVAHAA
jgi:hypothetical protein